jgi:hypothetical protein
VAAGAALAVLVVAGCGGSSSSQVKPAAYVKSMCTAIGNWRNTIQSAGVALQASNPASAPRTAAKADYQRFVTALVSATQRATTDLRSAGVPAVSGGKQLANRLNAAFERATHGLARAETQAKAIRTDSTSTFQLGASAVSSEIKSALNGIAAAAPGSSPLLRPAEAKEPSCQALR